MRTQTVRLADCAKVLPGFSTKGALADEPNGTHQVIMGKHLTFGEPYHYVEEHQLRIVPGASAEDYVVHPGDILYMSRGLNTYPVLLESVAEPSIAPSTFFILKAKREVLPGYLVWCLSQPATEAHVGRLRTGAGTPTIPRSGFAEVPVPLPDIDTQRKIADLWRLQGREQGLRQRLQEETGRLHALVGQKIYDTVSATGRERA